MVRYNKLADYYRARFGERVLKICVDGGFTCPNRDGSKGSGGCIFCSAKGSGEHIRYANVSEQVSRHLSSYRGDRANKFIVYFQNFTNTYAPVVDLKKIYDSALVSDKIIGLSIATRPDCVNDEVISLLKSYTDRYYVMVELGLQTANENIRKGLNLNYSVSDFVNATKLLREVGIDVVAHIILGLPGEKQSSIDSTIDLLNNSGVAGVKIHNLYVLKNTVCENMYNAGQLQLMDCDEYLEKLEYVLTHLRDDIVIHRISGDPPRDLLVAPLWTTHKKYILNGIDKLMKEHDTYQGMYNNYN
ncbi:MAG: TIGR01212 family radical SAM protein [Clostridiales bacterium]|nr:TIGR01212 family radical SAM protein [Clostridiales bacterium]